MRGRKRHNVGKRRRGSVIVQSVVFGGTVALGVAALAVDTGLMFSARQELQSAADAAALAAASQLGSREDALTDARAEAQRFANANRVAGDSADIIDSDVEFGRAELVGEKYQFVAGATPHDAVRVSLRRDQSAEDGPVSLLFAKVFDMHSARLSASATAMLVPRDIALVIDLSASMNDDSELRHYKRFASERTGYIDGVKINLDDIWTNLPVSKGRAGIKNGSNPSSPGACYAGDNQPGTGPGSPTAAAGFNGSSESSASGPAGPRFGWMTGWGEEITLGAYSPSSDAGLYHIPRNSTCSDADVIANLTEAGYTSAERSALLSGTYDSSSTTYRRRVAVLLGLAGWKSGKSGAKYSSGGDGDNKVESSELTQSVDYPFNSGSWDDFINYVSRSNSQMANTDSNLRYRYGLKTVVNYLLESRPTHNQTPELADTPEEPLHSVKNAVQVLVDELVSGEMQDQVSLETFAQYGNHRMDLVTANEYQSLSEALQSIADNLRGYQAGHDTTITNIGGGMEKAIIELSSERARSSAKKYVIMLTDGKPNVNSYNQSVGNNHPAAIDWAIDRADAAKTQKMTVFTVGVGGDVNDELLSEMASGDDKYFFADNQPDPTTGEPMYVKQLQQIFKDIGAKRPVRLIQ